MPKTKTTTPETLTLNRKQYPLRGQEPSTIVMPDPFSAEAFCAVNEGVAKQLAEAAEVKFECKEIAYVLLFLWPGSPYHELPGPTRAEDLVRLLKLEGEMAFDYKTFKLESLQKLVAAYQEWRLNLAARSLDWAASFDAVMFHQGVASMLAIGGKDSWFRSQDGPAYGAYFRKAAVEWQEQYESIFREEYKQREKDTEQVKDSSTVHEQRMREAAGRETPTPTAKQEDHDAPKTTSEGDRSAAL